MWAKRHWRGYFYEKFLKIFVWSEQEEDRRRRRQKGKDFAKEIVAVWVSWFFLRKTRWKQMQVFGCDSLDRSIVLGQEGTKKSRWKYRVRALQVRCRKAVKCCFSHVNLMSRSKRRKKEKVNFLICIFNINWREADFGNLCLFEHVE